MTHEGNESIGDLAKILFVLLIISIIFLVVMGLISNMNAKGIAALESQKKDCINKIQDNDKEKEDIRNIITAIQEKLRIYE